MIYLINKKRFHRKNSHASLIYRILIVFFYLKDENFFQVTSKPKIFNFTLNSAGKLRLKNNKYCILFKYFYNYNFENWALI